MAAITLTHLYALLSEKLGKEEAEAVTAYIEEKVEKTIDKKANHLATEADMERGFKEVISMLTNKMDTHFRWIIGTMIAMMGFMLGIVYFVLNYSKAG